jgi:hypothetical protein
LPKLSTIGFFETPPDSFSLVNSGDSRSEIRM